MERLTIDEIIEHCDRKARKYEELNGLNSLENSPLSSTFIKEYWEHKQVKNWLEEYKSLKEMEKQGKLIKLCCSLGSKVYVIAECSMIHGQLDGTLYGTDGGSGTATGYYCPYEDSCPHDCEEFTCCDDYGNKKAVFEDVVAQITIDERGVMVYTENCNVGGYVGEDAVFLTREQAEEGLSMSAQKFADEVGKKIVEGVHGAIGGIEE